MIEGFMKLNNKWPIGGIQKRIEKFREDIQILATVGFGQEKVELLAANIALQQN